MKYWTKTPGTGGSLLGEEDFVVDEIPLQKFLVKFERADGRVAAVTGPYFLYKLTKKGTTTKDAIKFVARKFGLEDGEIGFAGLKDKFAVTTQYVTLKKKVDGFETQSLALTFVSPSKNMMQVGELEGNRFKITLHGCKKPQNAKKILDELSSGMPNFFGPQRFSVGNEVIGRFILKRDYAKALDLINSTSGRNFPSLDDIGRKTLKFYIHAYQSFVFNSALGRYAGKPSFDDAPIVGFNTRLKNDFFGTETRKILESEGVSPKDFEFHDLRMKCTGGKRPAFIRVKNLRCEIVKDTLTLSFELPKGSYATTLIREIAKDDSR